MNFLDKIKSIFTKNTFKETSNAEMPVTAPPKNERSAIISDEILEKIKEKNKSLYYISDQLIRKMENHPKLVELLLEGSIPDDVLFKLQVEGLELPNEDDLKYISFFDLNERAKALLPLLNNQISINDIDAAAHFACPLDLENGLETAIFHHQIGSFLPNVKITLSSESVTKINTYSPIVIYFPKSNHSIVREGINKFITGNIDLNEDVIVQMDYDYFRFNLDEATAEKISKCKIVFSSSREKMQPLFSDVNVQDYRLVKYNHLIYVVENSSLEDALKEKLLYRIKNSYVEGYRQIYFQNELDILSSDEIESLTKNFEENIEQYMSKEIIKPEFNVRFYVDDMIEYFSKISVKRIIDRLNKFPKEEKELILKEPRIRKLLNIPDNLNENEFQKFLYLLGIGLDKTTIDFITRLDFNATAFLEDTNNRIQPLSDINNIVREFGVFDSVNKDIIMSIADLVGYDMNSIGERNILHFFKNFFQEGGDSYHTRSIGLLQYQSGEELLKVLEYMNHDTKDMSVSLVDEGKYIISSNGLHRFIVLRFHYLLDMMKKEKSEEELYELYKIPVRLSDAVNLKKTYCNYLIQKANQNIQNISFYQNQIIIIYKDEKEVEINENQLLDMAIQSAGLLDEQTLDEVMNYYETCETFKQFIDAYIPEILNKNNKGVQK